MAVGHPIIYIIVLQLYYSGNTIGAIKTLISAIKTLISETLIALRCYYWNTNSTPVLLVVKIQDIVEIIKFNFFH